MENINETNLDEIIQGLGGLLQSAKPKEKKKPPNIAESMTNQIKKKYRLVYYAGAFHLYKDGYYQKQIDIEFLSLIKDELPAGYKDAANARKVFDTLSIEKGVVLNTNDSRIEPSDLVCFKNCVYNLSTGAIQPHTADTIFFTQIPYDYRLDAHTDSMTEHLFNNFVKGYPAEDQKKMLELIYQVIGVAISNDRTMKNFFFIQGRKDTGKSTLLGLIKRILGEGTYSAINIQDLNESGTSLNQIIGKKANILTETSAGPLNENVINTLKKLTGGCEETISCKIKYKDDVEIRSRAILIFAGNTVPALWSKGDLNAFIDRMILVDFRGQVKDEDKIANILDKVSYEYIIAEAMRAYNRFLGDNRVFTVPEIVIENRQKLKNDDTVISFLNECERVAGYKIHAKTLFFMYKDWCENNCCTSNISKTAFNKKVEENGFEKTSVKETEGDKRSYVGFVGVKPPGEYLKPYLKAWGCRSSNPGC